MHGTGLAFLAGSSPDPTAVGTTLTGAMSWLGRAWEFAANKAESVQLVDAHGLQRTVMSTRTSSSSGRCAAVVVTSAS